MDGNLQSMSGKHYGTYEYDYNQQRVYQENKSIYGNEKIVTFYNKAGLALYDYNLTTQKTNKYLYLNGQRLSKVASDIKEAKVQNNIGSYYYNDAQGSPLAEVNEQGQTLWREAYLPFGAKLLNDIDVTVNKFGFVGKEMDESGLSYFGARYYNPISGRFMAPDSVEVKPEIPATFNRYAYGYNNPYKYVDPDGREVAPLPVMVAEFILGGIAGAIPAYREFGVKGGVIGFLAGGAGSVTGSFFSGKAAGMLAARTLLKETATMAIDISANASGSMLSSFYNKGEIEFQGAMTGALYGFGANRLIHRYGQFTPKTGFEAFSMGKYGATAAGTAEAIHTHIMSNNKSEFGSHQLTQKTRYRKLN